MDDHKTASEERRVGSLWGLKRIYYVMGGLALTGAVRHVRMTFESVCMLILFLTIAIRYLHGAATHFGEHGPPVSPASTYRHYQPLLDFLSFLVQAGLLVALSRELHSAAVFGVVLVALIVWDAMWVAATLIWGRAADHDTVAHLALKQWLLSDALLVSAIVACLIGLQVEPFASHRLMLIGALALLGIGAFVWDYQANNEYYFGRR